jgi:multidrug transporter EmrE-like cation transporter
MRWDVIGYGMLLASMDVVMEPIAKLVNQQSLSVSWMIFPTLVYAINPWIFLSSLRVEGIAIMNLVWNLVSNVFITGIGLYIFKEQLTTLKWIGLVLSFAAMYCLTAE